MTDYSRAVLELTRDLVKIDSRSFVSNRPIAERIEAELKDFELERLDYRDRDGVEKRALVAHRAAADVAQRDGATTSGLAFSGHMDTVPDTGWRTEPWSGRVENGRLFGLGSTDMKGPMAAAIVAARTLPKGVPSTLLISTDEETTKAGAREIAGRSVLARIARARAIVVVEPTKMVPMRGHRVHVQFTAVATGVQAHSSTGRGRNANWDLLPFLVEMRAIHERLRSDPGLQDPAYDPPFSDFNLVIDNHGAAVNVTVPKATATIKFRYSAKVAPGPVVEMVRDAARRAGLALSEAQEGAPPELAPTDPIVELCSRLVGAAPAVAPYGTDASELQALAPCVILGPGDIAQAHAPEESVSLAELTAAVPLFMQLAQEIRQ
ncbi:MAG: M20 family metallopeptidase [Alphaproteobacteria bacterium]|nr:MAG: M20 family metallopeptidase [Alphaproteobacteria bacterium]